MLMLILFFVTIRSVKFGNFNTSHVNVNQKMQPLLNLLQLNFNTSHVNVNHGLPAVAKVVYGNFNTSHVNVNLHNKLENRRKKAISIHLMLMLILRVQDIGVNLSYISIHLMLMLIY